jgi:hypothetical protein
MSDKWTPETPNGVVTVIDGKLVEYYVSNETVARWDREAEERRPRRKNWR